MDFDNKCVEVCPHCGHETEFEVSQIDGKGLITCAFCGERIHACSMCALLDGSPQCDWDSKTNTCSFRLIE